MSNDEVDEEANDPAWMRFIIRFGKYEGEKLPDIPNSYLEWIQKNFDVSDKNRFMMKMIDERLKYGDEVEDEEDEERRHSYGTRKSFLGYGR